MVATGFRPELDFLREVRLALDPALECPPALAPLIDPNVHSCGTVRPHGARELAQPEPGFYFAGMKSYGRAPTFLMLTGYEQVRSIVAEIAGDHEAARKVELVLPETGVCSGPGPLATRPGRATQRRHRSAGERLLRADAKPRPRQAGLLRLNDGDHAPTLHDHRPGLDADARLGVELLPAGRPGR